MPGKARKRRWVQIPLWLFMIFVPFAAIAMVILFEHFQERRHYNTEIALLQGKWSVNDYAIFEFKGNTLVMRTDPSLPHPRLHYATFRIFPGHSPKRITFDFGHPDFARGDSGIYEIEGDTLRLCTTNSDRPVPTEFRDDENANWHLMTLRRWSENAP